VNQRNNGLSASWDPVSLFFLLGQLVVCVVWLVPEWSIRDLAEPPYIGMLGSAIVVILLLVARAMSAQRLERGVLALFLNLMPAIYLAAWGVTEHGAGVWIEILGLVVFATLTILGLLVSPWYLALGIIAHGVFWDVWHHERVMTQHFIPSWYASACLVTDIGIGIYACLRIRAWKNMA
jgi:hypothetical protein